jgi:hypothetical protein
MRPILYIWSFPVTFFPLLLMVLVAWPLRQARPLGWSVAWEWEVVPHSWVDRTWHMAGAAIGWCVIYKPNEAERIRAHELAHVEQSLRLGPLIIILWPAAILLIGLACPSLHTYYDHPLELDARRATGDTFEITPDRWRLTRWWPWLRM